MARFYGEVGYANSNVEVKPGVWQDVIIGRHYYGDVLRISRRFEDTGEKVNGDISIGNEFSILADAYAYEHMYAIRYVVWQGQHWTVTGVEVARPRLLLRVGGLYHGDKA